MPPRKKSPAPQGVGFYVSISDYGRFAYQSTETVVVYVRNHIGQWYASGVLVSEVKLPPDLIQLRPVQS